MDEFEPELKRRLDVRASTIAVDDDWDDLINRSVAKARRTNKALALALVAVVCGASIVVVIAARGSEPPETRTAVPVAGVVPTGAKVPLIKPAAAPVSEYGKSASGGATTYSLATPAGIPITFWGGDAATKMAHVFTRTTTGGATIRTYRADLDTHMFGSGPPWWTPPGWCFPNGMVQADVSDDAIAGIGFGHSFAETKDGTGLNGAVSIVGQAEQHPLWIVVAHAPEGAATVRAEFPGGARDEMAPVDGVAVLVATGPGDDLEATAKLQAVDASGAVLGSVDVKAYGSWISESINQAECTAPTTLPPAGKEQPADPVEAGAAVRALFAAAFAKGISDKDFGTYFDDAHGFAEIAEQLRTGAFKDQVEAAQMQLKDLVFQDATTAAIQYDIVVPNYSTFANRFTQAKLIDGQWKLSREGWCNDVAMAGVSCPD
jgi:hypothetical protein